MGKISLKRTPFLIAIIAVAFVGGLFTAAYAGPILPMITLAGDVTITGDTALQGNVDVTGKFTGQDAFWTGETIMATPGNDKIFLAIPTSKEVIIGDPSGLRMEVGPDDIVILDGIDPPRLVVDRVADSVEVAADFVEIRAPGVRLSFDQFPFVDMSVQDSSGTAAWQFLPFEATSQLFNNSPLGVPARFHQSNSGGVGQTNIINRDLILGDVCEVEFNPDGARFIFNSVEILNIDADFEQVSVDQALMLVPQATAPSCSVALDKGKLYTDDSMALCWCDGSAWTKITGSGTCS